MQNTPKPFKLITNTYHSHSASHEDKIKPEEEVTTSLELFKTFQSPPKFISTANFFNPNLWNIHNFELGRYLGSGRFGRVYLAREKKTKLIVVLKQILKKQIVQNQMEGAIADEIAINSLMDHPNILKMYGYFHDETHVYLILEFAPYGNLFDLQKQRPQHRFKEKIAANFVRQVGKALNYCHSKNVIHRDLKPENLLVFQNNEIKLADFGWAAYTPQNGRKTYCGTPEYLAPEMLEGKEYSSKLDVWTIGILAYELVCGSTPFLHFERKVQDRLILSCRFSFPEMVTAEFRDFSQKILVKDPKERISMEALMNHKWLQ